MQLVAGIDTSTQSVKVVIRDAQSGQVIREGRAPHPDGSEVDPAKWWSATEDAIKMAGGLDDVSAIAVAGQQHGMVALDKNGEVIRPALLWNDTRSAAEATELNNEMGGGAGIANAVGSALVAAFTASKVRWLAKNEKTNADRVAAIGIPVFVFVAKVLGSTIRGKVISRSEPIAFAKISFRYSFFTLSK